MNTYSNIETHSGAAVKDKITLGVTKMNKSNLCNLYNKTGKMGRNAIRKLLFITKKLK